jgi:hypothetical protein
VAARSDASGEARVVAFKATVVFDPSSPGDLARAENELCTRGAHYRFVTIPVAGTVAQAAPVIAPLPKDPLSPVSAGVYYRRDQPYVLAVYDGGPSAGPPFTLVSAALIQMPNLAPRQRLALAASPGVATRANATFADGMLLSASVDSPSTARALASLPLDLARAIVSIPSALFQFRIDSTRDTARLSEARTEAIKAEGALLKAREASGSDIQSSPDNSD